MGVSKAGRANAPLSRSIREVLEDEIVTGTLPPGSHLEEIELAQRFGASRTPVREALQQLAAAGLVEIRPRRGAMVPQPDPHAVLEMFEAMAELEAGCARLAARRLTAEDRQALREAYERCRAAMERSADDYYHESESFHLLVHKASHNRILREQATTLLRRLRPYRRLQLRLPNRLALSLAEHEAMMEALFAHDPERAAQATRDHVQVQGQGFGDFMVLLRSVDE